jgi:hypothetical protein
MGFLTWLLHSSDRVVGIDTMGLFEAKNHLTALLDEVESGGEVFTIRRAARCF